MQVKVGFLIIPLSLLFFKTSSEKTEKPNEKDSRKTKQPNLWNSVSQAFCFFYFFLLQDAEKNLFRSHDPKPEVLMREVWRDDVDPKVFSKSWIWILNPVAFAKFAKFKKF